MKSLSSLNLPPFVEPFELQTERLLLRQWQPEDLETFAMMNADPEVMRCFPSILTRQESDSLARRCEQLILENGWGLWAVESLEARRFIGFIGLHANKHLPFPACTEVGWRLEHSAWGRGFATEGAQACLSFAFTTLNLDEVVSFTTVQNQRSQAVMQRLGMSNSGQNFHHPDIATDHPLSEHVLYKIQKTHWHQRQMPEK